MKKILFPKLKNKYDEEKKCVVILAYDGCSEKIFANPEVMPVYPEGQKALMAFVSDRVIPKLLKVDSTLTGTMVVNLSIKKVVAKISKCIVRKAQGLTKSLLEK